MTARPLALVYRGRASLPFCPEAVASLLSASDHNFEVRYVGDDDLSPETLSAATLYAQPGGGELRPAWRAMRRHREAIRGFVAGGGRYLGFCLGGYLAGATPGFGLIPGDVDQFIITPDATITDAEPHVVDLLWRERRRSLYFEDGPAFALDADADPATTDVLGRYENGAIASLAASFGAGRVGLIGPHPEADRSWYVDDGLAPVATGYGIGFDLIDAVMPAPTPTNRAASPRRRTRLHRPSIMRRTS